MTDPTTTAPLTKAEALTENLFHAGICRSWLGRKGGYHEQCERWRRNGATQTWKTRPHEFRVPVKYGQYGYGQITHRDAALFHPASRCPAGLR